MTHKPSKLVMIGCAVAIVFAAGAAVVLAGRSLGESQGKAAVERLQLLWPNVLNLPKADRILLARLSLDCNVGDVPVDKAAVRACLVQEAGRSDSKVENAQQDLARLLLVATP